MARILVIEDEENIRNMVRLALEHDGHTVGVAADGMEGVRLFGDGRTWNVVLLDQRMPNMRGVEALGRLRQRDDDAWVIMMTAMGTRELEDEARLAGAADFLRKPFTTQALRGAIAAALRGKKPLQERGKENHIVVNALTRNGFRIAHEIAAPATGQGGAGESGGVLVRFWERLTHAHAATVSRPDAPGTRLETLFLVENPHGEAREVMVVLPEETAAQAEKLRAATSHTRNGDDKNEAARFLLALCEEALSDYVSVRADFPADQTLVVQLNPALKQWIRLVAGNTVTE